MLPQVVLTALCVVATNGCGGGDGPATPTVASITVERLELVPAQVDLQVGEARQLSVIALDARGASVAAPMVTWASEAAGIASVSTGGEVTAIAPGSTRITAAVGTRRASATVVVTGPPARRAQFQLLVVADSGIEGTPRTGVLTVDSGTSVPYDYRLRSGFERLRVRRDTQTVAAAGRLVVDRPMQLSAVAYRAFPLPTSSQPLLANAQSALRAAQPAAAAAEYIAQAVNFLRTADTAGLSVLEGVRREATRDWSRAALDSARHRLNASWGARIVYGAPATANNRIAAYYINGVFADPVDQWNNTASLAALAEPIGITTASLLNPSWKQETPTPFLDCLLDSQDGRQRLLGIWNAIACNKYVQDLSEARAQIDAITVGAQSGDPFVTTVRETLEQNLDATRGVVLVAHSQGNMMVQEALRQLEQRVPPSALSATARCVLVLSVAAPLSDGWPSAFTVRGIIAAGAESKDVLLLHPNRNRFPTIASERTTELDTWIRLGAGPFGIPAPLDLIVAGFWLHPMATYLGAPATRRWLETRLQLAATELESGCRDIVRPSATQLTLVVGGTSPALTATRQTPTGRAVPTAEFAWRSLNPAIVQVQSATPLRLLGVSPGTTQVEVTSGRGSALIDVRVTALTVPTVTLTGPTTPVPAGSTFTLSWSSTGAQSCAAPWTTSAATAGSQTLTAGTSTTYTMSCIGAGGTGTASLTITVSAAPAGAGVRSIAGGASHTCAVTSDGRGWCWGSNLLSQSGGDGLIPPDFLNPRPLSTSVRFSQVTAGLSHGCGLATDGTPWCWGGGTSFNAIGNPSTDAVPTALRGGRRFASLSVGSYVDSCGIESSGATWCWGFSHSQFGSTPVSRSSTIAFASVDVGDVASCGIDTDGRGYCWGLNAGGNFGDGGRTPFSAIPVAVDGPERFRSIGAGQTHTCAIARTGQAFCWGANLQGELGGGSSDGLGARVTVPRALVTPLRFSSIAVGKSHNCALSTTGEAYCWGSNSHGQLGIGVGGDRNVVTAVVGGLRFRELVAGYDHTCGVDLGGAAWCWGRNSSGQLGDGTRADRAEPVRVRFP